jgi:hypothetical protein
VNLFNVGHVVVAVVAGGLMLIGLAYLCFPAEILSLTGQFALDSNALVDVRATYGGIQLGLGVFLGVQAIKRENILFSLRLLAMVFAAVGGVRIVGSYTHLDVSYLHTVAAVAEIACAGGCMFLSVKISDETS